jgi:hypothetical protein
MDTVKFIEHNYYDNFPYKNYTDTNIHFPEIKDLKEQIYTHISLPFLTGDSLKRLQLIQEIPDDWFDILFIQDIINRWDEYDPGMSDSTTVSDVIFPDNFEYPYKDRKDYLKKARKYFKIYLLGNVSLNKNFLTKLIFVRMRDEFADISSLFLVNIKNNYLKSITEISECYSYINKDECSDYKNFRIVGNMLFTTEGGWGRYYSDKDDIYKQFDYYPIFHYDDYGYLIVLE